MADPLLVVDQVRKHYGDQVITEVLRGVDLELEVGEFAALIGTSGSGKSTLLNQVGLLDQPSSGTITLSGTRVDQLDDDARTKLRSEKLGFIFQFHHLIGAFSAIQNVSMPLSIQSGHFDRAQEERALSALEEVGLRDRASARPSELSGGQQQRVAIARALIHRPALVLADEPTGNLDSKTADEIFTLMRKFNQKEGTSFLVVTHDPNLAARCDRVLRIVDGVISDDG